MAKRLGKAVSSMLAIIEPRDEARLIALILAGEAALYLELIRPYERCVYMTTWSHLKDTAAAEDAAQKTFLRAFHHLSSFRAEVQLCAWLVGIAWDESRRHLRPKDGPRVQSIDDTPEQTDYVSPSILRDWREVPSEALERNEVCQMLQKAVVELPDACRAVFLLCDVEGLTDSETAAALSIHVEIVKARLHRSRMMLQRQLTPQLRALPALPLSRLA